MSEDMSRLEQLMPATSVPGPLFSVYAAATDGVLLALDVVIPEHVDGARFPTVLMMTRYWRSTVNGSLEPWLDRWQKFYTQHGFAVVTGDVRGTGASFGKWPYHRHRAERNDMTALIDWIISQPWSDGRVIGAGTSYSANTADWMAACKHPALKAVTPRYADFDPYTDLYFPGGVPNRHMGETWGTYVKELDQNRKVLSNHELSPGVRPVDGQNGKALLQAAIKEHADAPSVWLGIQQIVYRDDQPDGWNGESMTDFGICSPHSGIASCGVPMQNWGSWYDAGTANGSIHRFHLVPDHIHVIIGPWSHGGSHTFDPLRPDESSISPKYHQQQLEDLLFITDVLANRTQRKQKSLSYYTCGEGRWKTTSVWPPANSHNEEWYFGSNSLLSQKIGAAGVDTYKVDFDVGTGPTSRWITNHDGTHVRYEDRSAVDERLFCYTSLPLEKNTEITGHPALTLFLSSTETDGAIFAYLEAVAPDGRVIYLTEGQLRLQHRRVAQDQLYPTIEAYHSFRRVDAAHLVPGGITEIKFNLHPISVRVPAGFRLRIAVAGADKDIFTRIPTTGDPVIQIHRSQNMRSRIDIPTVADGAS